VTAEFARIDALMKPTTVANEIRSFPQDWQMTLGSCIARITASSVMPSATATTFPPLHSSPHDAVMTEFSSVFEIVKPPC
jgi:hypothetical protein